MIALATRLAVRRLCTLAIQCWSASATNSAAGEVSRPLFAICARTELVQEERIGNPLVLGTIISISDLKVRLALSEVFNPRWGEWYARCRRSLAPGTQFEELQSDQKDELVRVLEVVRVDLVTELDKCAAFTCVGWSKADLARACVLVRMNPSEIKERHATFAEYAAAPPTNNWFDPRRIVARVPLTQAFEQTEPVVVLGRPEGINVLYDGYCRSLLFHRQARARMPLLVWHSMAV